MVKGNPNDIPNPFAFGQPHARPRRRRPLFSAIKLLGLVAIAFSVTVFVGSRSQNWLVNRIASDFQSLPREEKLQRLGQLADLGMPAIESIVTALNDPEEEVARTAYELLRQAQNEWTVLPRRQVTERHRLMIEAIEAIAVQVPDERTGWISSLVQQSISESVDRRDNASRQLYTSATEMLDRMSLSERPGPSILIRSKDEPDQPRRLNIVSRPLPVSSLRSTEPLADERFVRDRPGNSLSIADSASSKQSATEDRFSPSVYRSSATPLQPIGPNDVVQLRPIPSSPGAALDEAPEPSAITLSRPPTDSSVAGSIPSGNQTSADGENVRPVSTLVDSPLEAYDTRSVVYWLGSSNESLRLAARTELQRRGLSSDAITIATRIAAGDVQTKIDLIDALARDNSIDPRPWLLILMRDPSRDVKLRTISVLATMNDPEIDRQLREHEVDEPDPTVAFRIRRVLDMR